MCFFRREKNTQKTLYHEKLRAKQTVNIYSGKYIMLSELDFSISAIKI